MRTDSLEVRMVTGKGRGVFTRRTFEADEVIECCPVVGMAAEHWEHLDRTTLEIYCFKWGENLDRPALALGYGSLYNHSFAPNAVYRRVLETQSIDFIALRAIAADQEILVNYNGDPNGMDAVWFSPVD